MPEMRTRWQTTRSLECFTTFINSAFNFEDELVQKAVNACRKAIQFRATVLIGISLNEAIVGVTDPTTNGVRMRLSSLTLA
jgi:hypothetical protein